jgi:hypothetical protein
MNNCYKLPSVVAGPSLKPAIRNMEVLVGKITRIDKDNKIFFIKNTAIICASSLLIKPSIDDLVCFINEQDQYYIIQILHSAQQQPVVLQSEHPIHLNAPSVRLQAWQDIELVSLNRLSMIAKHGTLSVASTLIMNAESLIQKVKQLSISAKGLLTIHGKQQVITAEEDVRIDGKRINMG